MIVPTTACAASLDHAADLLAQGGVVAFPTETVYGVGADARNRRAVQRLYDIKGRKADRPAAVLIASSAVLSCFASAVPHDAMVLAEALWPGPLTLVLPGRPTFCPEVMGSGCTVGLRVSDHPVASALVAGLVARRGEATGIAAPSANRSGEAPPCTAGAVLHALGAGPDMVLDGGPSALAQPSTVVDFTRARPRILRVGAVPHARIERLVGRKIDG
jgi:L-threonylcarbamoyladenylate synthase